MISIQLENLAGFATLHAQRKLLVNIDMMRTRFAGSYLWAGSM